MILSWLFGASGSGTPAPDDDFWYSPAERPTFSGQKVTNDSALRVTAVFSCVRVLAETVASMPLIVYRNLPDGGKERAQDHPLNTVLRKRPNKWQTAFEWFEMMQGHVALRGNAYSQIIPGKLGAITELVPIHPDRVCVERLENGKLRYEVRRPDNVEPGILTQEEMFHLRGLSSDGLVGLSPVAMARQSIGLAQATEQYGGTLFKNGAKPGGILEHPARLSKDAATKLRESWQETHGGTANAHKTAILEEGMKYHELGMNNEDAQFIETRKYQRSEIASIFRMPPHLIGDMEHATFSNIEHQSLEFIIYTMMPWFERWEQAIQRDLVVDDEEYFCEFLVDGLLRGDINSRYSAYSTGRQWGWLSVNDVRALENMNPVDNGDVYLQPMNMVEAGAEEEDPEADGVEIVEGDGAADEPMNTDTKAAQTGDVQATALNGAQIASLLSITDKLSMGQYPAEGTRAILEAAFPLMDKELINTIVTTLEEFDPEETAAPAEPFPPSDEPSGEPEDEPEDETEEEPDAASSRHEVFSILIRDAAERIMRAEIGELEKRASKAAQDRPRFDAWVDEFYGKHTAYVTRTLEPIAKAIVAQGGKEVSLNGIVGHLVQSATLTLKTVDPVEVLHDWQEYGADKLSNELIGRFLNGKA